MRTPHRALLAALAPALLLPTACAARHFGPFSPCLAPAGGTTPPERFGTEHPIVVVATSPQRRWAAYCQARSDTDGDGAIRVSFGRHGDTFGDRLDAFLKYDDARELPIDDFVAGDPQGRFVVVVVSRRLVLVDAIAGSMDTLDADPSPGDEVVGPHRAARFDASGSRMLYLRGTPTGATVVVRDLCSRAESTISPGPGQLLAADFDASGKEVVLAILRENLDETGPRFMAFPSFLAPRRCRGDATSVTTLGGSPEVAYRVADAAGGTARVVDEPPPLAARAPAGPTLVVESSRNEAARSGFGDATIGPLRWKD